MGENVDSERRVTYRRDIRKFEPGVEKILKKMYGDSKIDSEAIRLICTILNNLCKKAIQKLKDTKSSHPTVEQVQKVIRKLLPPTLLELAMSEGQKEVFLSEAMPLKFDFKKKTTKEERETRRLVFAKNKEDKLLSQCFRSGVRTVSKQAQPGSKIDKIGSERISLFLNNLTDALVEKLKETNPNKPTHDDVRKATEAVLPPSLGKHAKSEGTKMVFRFQNQDFESILPESLQQRELQQMESNWKDYKIGLSRILKKTHANAVLQPKAEKLICQKLNYLSYEIINKLKETPDHKTQEDVETVVQLFLPPLLAEHAAAEGQKMVDRFDNDEFDSRIATEMRLTERKNHSPLMTFSLERGILAIARTTHPLAILHKSGLNYINVDLNNLLNTYITKIKQSAPKHLTSADIQKATKGIISPKTLANLAMSEGQKMVSLFETNGIEFVPPVNNTQRRRSTFTEEDNESEE